MPVLTGQGLGKSFGPVDIFSDLTFSIPHRARIGLVGANGVGKTTLLRILVGDEEASTGSVQMARGTRLGYLPQEVVFDSNRTLWDECLNAFEPLLALQAEMTRLETQMSAGPHDDALIESYGKLQQQFEHQGGYTYETRIRMILTGLSFTPADEHRPLNQLSGGQRTRAYLARLLLSSPDLLLLDEPTNHLDIAAIEWLESFLRDWDGAVLIVSHDRYFLDQVATVIWEMTPALEIYRGNYSAYLLQRSERYKRRIEEYESQTEFIEKEEEYIRRNMAGQNTRQAQGRQKRLERLLDEARLVRPIQPRRLHMNLQPVSRSGDLVVRTFGLSVGYADEGKPLFTTPDLVLRRTECAAVIGPNGAGKTTFLKTLLEQIPPYAGEARLGSSLKIGYFAQAHEGLHAEWTLMEEINALAPDMLPGQVRDYLASFLFTGDDVFKPVSILSGGERGRLALACLALQGANLLLLDEPTNHLDLPSQEVLQSILSEYKGTILLVSHDRYLIDALATQIWEVLPDEGSLRVFEGTYSEYKLARQLETQQAASDAAQAAPVKAVESPRGTGLSKMELKKRQDRLKTLETEIAELERQQKTLAQQLENPEVDPTHIQKLGQDFLHVQQELEARLETWSELAGEL